MAVDDHLHGAPRAVGSGEIDALLQLDHVLMRVEGPGFAVGQYQHDAVAVAQPVRLDGGMQVEADGKGILGARQVLAMGRHEQVLAFELIAVRGNEYRALVNDIESVGIAVVRGAKQHAVVALLAGGDDLVGAADHRAAEHLLE